VIPGEFLVIHVTVIGLEPMYAWCGFDYVMPSGNNGTFGPHDFASAQITMKVPVPTFETPGIIEWTAYCSQTVSGQRKTSSGTAELVAASPS